MDSNGASYSLANMKCLLYTEKANAAGSLASNSATKRSRSAKCAVKCVEGQTAINCTHCMGRFKAWLPVKPSGNLQLLLDGDMLKFSGEVRLWNMTEDPDRTVRLWEKYVRGTNNVTLGFSGVSTATVGRYSAGWYSFNETEDVPFLSLDPTAVITNMRFTVTNKLEDQGIGFAVQDSLVFSETSCTTSQNPIVGRFDVAVRDGLNPTPCTPLPSTGDTHTVLGSRDVPRDPENRDRAEYRIKMGRRACRAPKAKSAVDPRGHIKCHDQPITHPLAGFEANARFIVGNRTNLSRHLSMIYLT
ncbi:hypothetical protein B0H17DRAFT_1131084 [Mycena rosella]|uniref:Uncharacterized protein n=1 Tax=Mycena rosella TaxID=1033263 RepID=A0AAD7DPH2_MYCRO|nr:hypothetical protein B0H17DRAFT_1131084 [Mycena rosella]